MKPKVPDHETDMFKTRLDDLIDLKHPLATVAKEIDWTAFDGKFEPLFCLDNGRPAIPTRLMVALHYLKYTYNLSDEETVYRWVENPYWQYFSGEEYFRHDLPIDPSSMTRWRKRLSAKGMEALLEETIKTGFRTGMSTPIFFFRFSPIGLFLFFISIHKCTNLF